MPLKITNNVNLNNCEIFAFFHKFLKRTTSGYITLKEILALNEFKILFLNYRILTSPIPVDAKISVNCHMARVWGILMTNDCILFNKLYLPN